MSLSAPVCQRSHSAQELESSAPSGTPTGQRLGEYERGGGLKLAAEQIGGAGSFESQGATRPRRVRTSVSSIAHPGSSPGPGAPGSSQ
jgi:hypothetical protein